jgi:hypothetical protein
MNDRQLDWDALQAEWVHAADGASVVAAAQGQLARARRGAWIGQAVEALVAAVAVAFVALALHHAANALHAALGIIVGGAICAIWIWRRELARQEQRSLEASGIEHLVLMRVIARRQSRMALFIEAVVDHRFSGTLSPIDRHRIVGDGVGAVTQYGDPVRMGGACLVSSTPRFSNDGRQRSRAGRRAPIAHSTRLLRTGSSLVLCESSVSHFSPQSGNRPATSALSRPRLGPTLLNTTGYNCI